MGEPATDLRPQTYRTRYELMRSALENERASFLSHWRELGDYILPRRPRFSLTDTNRGDKRNSKIIDSTATLAARTLRSGMMSGVTSPARPWFRLTTPDPELAEFGPVKEWLHFVAERMRTMFLRSNLYQCLPVVYGDIGVFGTSALFMEEDLEKTAQFYPMPIGSYCISNGARLNVDTFQREFRLTVRQLVQKFGYDKANKKIDWTKFSIQVKNLWDTHNLESWIDVVHVIHPNEDFSPNMIESKFKRYRSCYYEKGSYNGAAYSFSAGVDDNRYLRESGYDFFPVLAPRWETNGEDVYGTDCPGMTALGDIKALQLMQKRKAQAIEKMINPPMVGPADLKNARTSTLPGDMNYVNERTENKGFRPLYQVEPRIDHLLADIMDHQQRTRRVFFEDLFLMLAQSDRREITAREIEERHEEKLLAVGPVLEQLNQDMLDPLVDNSFEYMLRQGEIPPAPEEMQGVKLKVEYISIMAQAQKLVGVGGIERFAGFTGQVATVTQDPTVMDKVDTDQLIDEYGEAVGISPRIIRSDEKVAAMREERAASQQQEQAAAQARELAAGAKDLSQTDMKGDNALTRLMSMSKAGQVAPQ